MKRIVWTEPAKADVRRVDRDIAMRIFTALDHFVRSGEGDVKALQGREELRLRIGDYRLFFNLIADALECAVNCTDERPIGIDPFLKV